MGLENLVDEEEDENQEEWKVIPVDIEVIARKQIDITVRNEEEFVEKVENEMQSFETWVASELFSHPDVMVEIVTDSENLTEEVFS